MSAIKASNSAPEILSTSNAPAAIGKDGVHLKPINSAPKNARKISPLFLSVIAVLSVLGILTAQLWLNLSVSSGAYEIGELAYQQNELDRVERSLQIDVDMLASPQNLATEAARLGMVQNSRPAYLKLESSKITGSAKQSTSAPTKNLVHNSALSDLKETEKTVPNKTPNDTNKSDKAGEKAKAEKTSVEKPVKSDSQKTEKTKPIAEKTDAKTKKSGAVTENSSSDPIVWQGKLVAPSTH